tara:strand:- start:7454 stop:7783 length:330 start_codon:yes stop_codon:yes gene_type:complete
VTRRAFPADIKVKALQKYNNRCYKCGEPFNEPPDYIRPQYDHKNGDKSDNSLRNCGPICPNCHDKKSRKENSKRDSGRKGDNNFGFGDPFGGDDDDPMGFRDVGRGMGF